MNLKIFTAAASAALLVGAGHASAAVVTIDTFDETDQAVADDPIGDRSQASAENASEVVGGERDLYVLANPSDQDGAATLVVDDDPEDPSDGVLSFNTNSGFQAGGWVVYDGDDNNPNPFAPDLGLDGVDKTGLNGLDLFDGPLGNPGFLFEVVRVDLSLLVEIMAWDMSGETTTFSAPVVAGGTPLAPFSAFSSNPDFDWNNVGALQFFASSNGVDSVDAAISSISVDTGVIPLPASALLLLGGLGGLSAFGMRRKRSR